MKTFAVSALSVAAILFAIQQDASAGLASSPLGGVNARNTTSFRGNGFDRVTVSRSPFQSYREAPETGHPANGWIDVLYFDFGAANAHAWPCDLWLELLLTD